MTEPDPGTGGRAQQRAAAAAADLRLLVRIEAGDRSAFEALYRAHHAPLTRFLSGLVRSPEQVEEVLNDTLVAVWRKPSGFKGASKLSTWLFSIAYRKALRARARFDLPMEDLEADRRVSDEPDPQRECERSETQTQLDAAIRTLSAEHRAVIELTYYNELPYQDIAVILDCPVDTVKSRMFYAKRKLRAVLAGDLFDWL